MSNWLSRVMDRWFNVKNQPLKSSVVIEQLNKSKEHNKQSKKLVKEFKAHLDREDYWLTCECYEKPKDKKKNGSSCRTIDSTSSNYGVS